jgi:hypothetical protein
MGTAMRIYRSAPPMRHELWYYQGAGKRAEHLRDDFHAPEDTFARTYRAHTRASRTLHTST